MLFYNKFIGFLLIILCKNSISIELTDENWKEALSENEWMVKFYAPWCPACNRMQSTWEKFEKMENELNIKVGSVDLTTYPSLSGLFFVTSLPTIYHVKNSEYRVYEGNRDLNDLVDFVKSEKWRDIKPVNEWISPNSHLMQAVGYLLKTTIYFKDFYTFLTETYGLPNYLVMGIFVLVTILLGLLLGIFFILCIDFVCAPRKTKKEFQDSKDDDLPCVDDNIENELIEKEAKRDSQPKQSKKSKKSKSKQNNQNKTNANSSENDNNTKESNSNVRKRNNKARKD